MTNRSFKPRVTLERLPVGPLGRYIDAFAGWLSEQGYAKYSLKYGIGLIRMLSCWMDKHGFGINHLDEQIAAKFLKYRGRNLRIRRGDMATLRSFVGYLRQSGVVPPAYPEVDDSEMSPMEHDFAEYLTRERNLSKLTWVNYLPTVRRLLEGCFGKGPILLEEIAPADISRFVLRQARILSRGRAKLVVTALRSFFRFLYLRGDINVDLAVAVPAVANWRLATLPKWIPPEQVEQLINSCDQSIINGQRNYAILLLLARLGLRSAEVVAMTLEDIDWEAGEIRVRGKSGRSDRLPLPQDIGKALVRYLRDGRPCCSTRQVFVRTRAPHRGFIDSTAIYSLVRRAFDRAGLKPTQRGVHTFCAIHLPPPCFAKGRLLGRSARSYGIANSAPPRYTQRLIWNLYALSPQLGQEGKHEITFEGIARVPESTKGAWIQVEGRR